MNEMYFFSINDKQAGPFDQETIRKQILAGVITGSTLAWCQGMSDWQAVQKVPNLMTAFGNLISAQVQPPPLPARQTATPPPLPPGGHSAIPRMHAGGAGSLNDQAYGFVTWLYRPWRGRISPVRKYVDQDPQKRALPVAVGTVAMFALIIYLGMTSTNQVQNITQAPSQQPQVFMPSAAGQAALMDAQRYSQQISDDVYKYQRDAGDRRDETYRRATYDWYGRDDD